MTTGVARMHYFVLVLVWKSGPVMQSLVNSNEPIANLVKIRIYSVSRFEISMFLTH